MIGASATSEAQFDATPLSHTCYKGFSALVERIRSSYHRLSIISYTDQEVRVGAVVKGDEVTVE